MICSQCRREIVEGVAFCKYCGASVEQRICANGHVMHPTHQVCAICGWRDEGSTASRIGGSTPVPAGAKRKTMIEDPKAHQGIKGGTLREEEALSHSAVAGAASPQAKRETIFRPDPISQTGQASGAASRALVGWLVTFSRKSEGEDFRLREGRNVIGATTGSDVHIADPSVSGEHAFILFRRGRFTIQDNLSTNGTFVNGREIERIELNDGDEITVGDTSFLFRTLRPELPKGTGAETSSSEDHDPPEESGTENPG